MSNEFFNEKYVEEKFGVLPEKVAELLALVGDKSDNIPGITKVGNKTASKWLNQYGNIDNLVAKSGEITGVVGENIRKEKDILQRNLFLVSLKKDLDLNLEIDDLSVPEALNNDLKDFYQSLEFNSFIEERAEKKISKNYRALKNLEEL